MKVTLSVLAVLAISLTVGLAYAADVDVSSREWSNGITYFDTGTTCDCESAYSVAPGGLVAEAPVMANGITYFELAAPDSIPNGLCAGKIGDETSWINNGITSFD